MSLSPLLFTIMIILKVCQQTFSKKHSHICGALTVDFVEQIWIEKPPCMRIYLKSTLLLNAYTCIHGRRVDLKSVLYFFRFS